MESQLRRRFETRLAALVRHSSDVVGDPRRRRPPHVPQPVGEPPARPRRRRAAGAAADRASSIPTTPRTCRVPRGAGARSVRAAPCSASATPTAPGATSRRPPPTCAPTQTVGGIVLNTPRRQRAQGARAPARAPGVPRRADRPAEPRAVPGPRRAGARAGAGAAARASPSSSSTSTTSRRSTTRSATPPATRCCARSAARLDARRARVRHRRAPGRRRVRRCCSRASATTSRRSRVADRIDRGARAARRASTATSFTSAPSVGIAFARRRRRSAEELLRDADAAMYLAKDAGQGPLRVFEPGMHAAARRAPRSSRRDLQRAVERRRASRSSTSRSSTCATGDDRRRRGARALAAPERGAVAAGGVHPARRGDRA